MPTQAFPRVQKLKQLVHTNDAHRFTGIPDAHQECEMKELVAQSPLVEEEDHG
jgi:hypothetical protein